MDKMLVVLVAFAVGIIMLGAMYSEYNEFQLAKICIENGGEWKDNPDNWVVRRECLR